MFGTFYVQICQIYIAAWATTLAKSRPHSLILYHGIGILEIFNLLLLFFHVFRLRNVPSSILFILAPMGERTE